MPQKLYIFPFTQHENFGRITTTFAMSVEELTVLATIICIVHNLTSLSEYCSETATALLNMNKSIELVNCGDYVFLEKSPCGKICGFSILIAGA